MHKQGSMLSLDALKLRPCVSFALTPYCVLPSINAQVEHWLTLFIHMQQDFDEKYKNRKKFGLVNNHIFTENKR